MTAKKKKTNLEGSSKKVNGAKKGKSWEREIANAIGHIFPEAKRHLEYQASAAAKGIDLEGTGCFKIQAKNYQGYAPIGKIFEIKELCEEDIPLLITKGNRLPPMVVLPFESMIYLMEVLYGLAPQKQASEKTLKTIEAGNRIRDCLGSPKELRQIGQDDSKGSNVRPFNNSGDYIEDSGEMRKITISSTINSDAIGNGQIVEEYADESELSAISQEHLKKLEPKKEMTIDDLF